MLELRGIDKYYNPGTVNEMCLFDHFNLTVEEGEFVSVVGSNGSGKTSMLNILCGSIPVDAGSVSHGFTPLVIIVAVKAAPSGKLPSTVRSGKSRIL